VRDAGGCSVNSSVTISASVPLQFTTGLTQATCGQSNGQIRISPLNGTPPFSYSLDGSNFSTSNVFNGLGASIYNVFIKDAKGCTASAAVTISASSGLLMNVIAKADTCGAGKGSLQLAASGGVGPYLFSLDGQPYVPTSLFKQLQARHYAVDIKDALGCQATAIVTVEDFSAISLNAGSDASICDGAAITMTAISDANSFSWSPANGLTDAKSLITLAKPVQTTLYVLTATKGSCTKKDSVLITVIPSPIAQAGNDTTLCFGASLQLIGKGGTTYNWSPSLNLTSLANGNPVFHATQQGVFHYALQVIDGNGCRSKVADSLVITVLPAAKVFAGNDTTIASNQPLQLNAVDVARSGFIRYNWTPANLLQNASSANPVATLPVGAYDFVVTATSQDGCTASDNLVVKVFLRSDLFVPNAFTPNNDGKNDQLKVIPVGIRQLKFFSIYNRWGQLVFRTESAESGWDGRLNGVMQDSGNYVWIAEAIDINGNVIARKGYALLIR
jgi:gliding motility-associated-like protein